jgi:anti-sigma B factor antagonist
VTLALRGEIDVYTAPDVRQKVLDVVASGRCLIVVNLQDVTYLDSTGLGVLIGALRRARELGGDIAFVSSNARVNRILDITGLSRVFHMCSSEQSAVAMLEQGRQIAKENA